MLGVKSAGTWKCWDLGVLGLGSACTWEFLELGVFGVGSWECLELRVSGFGNVLHMVMESRYLELELKLFIVEHC